MLTVSAVLPTYNGTRYLREALQSVVAQTYPVSEIIVVDDGSKEDIRAILRPFPGVTYVRQENTGPAAARNYGISVATGDVIAFLDDDDIWKPEKTAEQIRYLEEDPECSMVYSYPELIDENGALLPNGPPLAFPHGFVYLDFVKKNRISTPSATLIKRTVFYEAGFFDESREYFCGEDYDLWLRISEKHRIAFCPGNLISYRIRGAGISKNLANAMKGDLYLLRKLLDRHIRQATHPDRSFYHAFDYNLYHTFRRYALGYHYTMNNRNEAASLLVAALNRHRFYRDFRDDHADHNLLVYFDRRLPYYVTDIFYLGIFCMPESFFNFLRRMKRKAVNSLMPAEKIKST